MKPILLIGVAVLQLLMLLGLTSKVYQQGPKRFHLLLTKNNEKKSIVVLGRHYEQARRNNLLFGVGYFNNIFNPLEFG
jgi:hypothetical protein